MHEGMKDNRYKISVVIPVFQTEKYFERCITSLMRQTYQNMEMIIVDDCSTGNIKELAESYMRRDSRIRLISHKTNKGLFLARLTGAQAADGDFLAFLDSDDYVSMDYYHTLLEAAVLQEADIVVGKTVHEAEDGRRQIYNLHRACFRFDRLIGEDVRQAFFGQRGMCFSWHTIWNKLYRKSLWDRCAPYYQSGITSHVVMAEDIAFSTVLFYFAKSVAAVENDAYFYCQHKDASTDGNTMTIQRFEKNIRDLHAVFDFCEQFLKKADAKAEYRADMHEFRKYYARLWRTLSAGRFIGKEQKKRTELLKSFCLDETERASKDDYFFESIKTSWNGELEHLKECVCTSECAYVSFDIFDTLVNRPFYKPEHLFSLLDKEWEGRMKCSMSFSAMRMMAERLARKKCSRLHPKWEDVTLEEIYQCMSADLLVPMETAEAMMRAERALEIQFGGVRNAGRQLYEAALLAGKRVIFVSDMYLDADTIKTILERNGYTQYDRLYLSSQLRLSKYTGRLFQYVKKELNLPAASRPYHIGDTWENDVVNAKKNGFAPLFLPKAVEAFENVIQGVSTNACAFLAEAAAAGRTKKDEMRKSIGFGCMLALVANRYFDNPFQSFHEESDLNMDPFLVGYYPLGMHLMGITAWIGKKCSEKGVSDIHFLARDGYLVQKAYERVADIQKEDAPKAHYLYASRKALLCGMIQSEQDFFCLPVVFGNHTPKSLLEMLEFAAEPEMTMEDQKKLLSDSGIDYEKRFLDEETYIRFMNIFVSSIYSPKQLQESREFAGRYYEQIGADHMTFDMGYSGRIQTAISNLLGRGVDVLFIHSDSEHSARMQRIGNYTIYPLYPDIPKVSGLLREHLLSDHGPACIGFEQRGGDVQPKLEPEEKIYQDTFIISSIQKAALQFVEDFTETFRDYWAYVPYRAVDVSLPFEGYLSRIRYSDRKIYSASYFEDQVYGACRNINIEEFLNQTILLGEEDHLAAPKDAVYWRRLRHFIWLKLKDHKALYSFGKFAGRFYDKIFIRH